MFSLCPSCIICSEPGNTRWCVLLTPNASPVAHMHYSPAPWSAPEGRGQSRSAPTLMCSLDEDHDACLVASRSASARFNGEPQARPGAFLFPGCKRLPASLSLPLPHLVPEFSPVGSLVALWSCAVELSAASSVQ